MTCCISFSEARRAASGIQEIKKNPSGRMHIYLQTISWMKVTALSWNDHELCNGMRNLKKVHYDEPDMKAMTNVLKDTSVEILETPVEE